MQAPSVYIVHFEGRDVECYGTLEEDSNFSAVCEDEEDDSSRSLSVEASRISGKGSTDLLWDWEEGRFEEYAAFSNIKSI